MRSSWSACIVYSSLVIFCICLHIGLQVNALTNLLKYDVECPWLTDAEYAQRLAAGRCPRRTESTSTTPPTPSTPRPAALNETRFYSHVRRRLLKLVFVGTARIVNLTLDRRRSDSHELIEGTFVEMNCDASFAELNNGLPLDAATFDWRVHAEERERHVFITPTLSRIDTGYFECYVNDQFRGGVHVLVVTMGDALLDGLRAYAIGVVCTTPLTVAAIVYRVYRPITDVLDDDDAELFGSQEADEDVSLEFDEMMLQLSKVEKAET